MFLDPKFWLAISFTIFVILMIKYVVPIIIRMIDGKIDQVSQDIKQARQMKEQAQNLLKEAEQYHKDTISLSKQLIDDAKKEVEDIIINSQKEIEEELDRKMDLALDRISQEEQNAVKEMKAGIINSAMNLIKDNIDKVSDSKTSKAVNNDSIEDIKKAL